MGIFYCLTVLVLISIFMLVKKSDKKLNFISWGILSLITYLAYNVLICMIFGVLNITTNLLFLSIVNLIISICGGIKIYKDKKIQSYEIRKRDILAVVISAIIVCYIAITQYKPLANIIANASVDACMHYSAATNFADNMKVLSKIDNTTGYNFKTMQTGAYINTGIFMNVVRSVIPSFEDYKTFKIFEIGVFALNILAFYMLIQDKLKDKFKYCIGIIFLVLYAFAFPYTSLLYGFSYLSVAIAFATGLLYIAKIYQNEETKFIYNLCLIVFMCTGIIFSYCLFVPALFAFICIELFICDLKKKDKKAILKIFRKNTLITTGILLVLTVLSICYLVIPTFTDSDQNKLTDAIGFDGGIYKALYQDFLFYVPFIILFIYNAIKNKKIDYKLTALVLILGQTFACFAGLIIGFVSPYYYYKMYYILWIVVLSIAVDIICELKDNKEMTVTLTGYLITWCLIIICAVSGWDIKLKMKVPTLIEKYESQNFAGIYFDTNILSINNIKASCLVSESRIEIAEKMSEIEDITLKNMLVGGMNTNCKAWMYVISGIECGGESINDLQKAVVETSVDDFLQDDEKEYFILYDESDTSYDDSEYYEVVFRNEAGVILHKK